MARLGSFRKLTRPSNNYGRSKRIKSVGTNLSGPIRGSAPKGGRNPIRVRVRSKPQSTMKKLKGGN